MATIKVKRSAVAGRVPATTDLELGEIAINTYDGVAYVKKNVSGTETVVQLGSANLSQNLQNRYQYTATAAQTTFSAVYLAPYVDVYLNGIRLIAGVDYTATNGTTVVLTTAASLNNTIDIVAYTSYTANANFADLISSHVTTALGYTPENPANKGVANGYASLNSSGQIPSAQLPSFVDDVVEYANLAALPATGETGKIYVTQDTNKTYRWSGSAYTEIASSPGSTDAVTEGSSNLYFTNARARNALSATQNLTYSSSTGVFTGPDLSGYLTSATAATVYAPLASPSFSGSVTISGGTANGIPYLNASKVLTTGSTLRFTDGTLFNTQVAGNNQTLLLNIQNSTSGTAAGSAMYWGNDASQFNAIITKWSSAHSTKPNYFEINNVSNAPIIFGVNNAEQFRVAAGQVTTTGGIFKASGAPSLIAAADGEAILAPEPSYGALLYGKGSVYDVVIGNRGTGIALAVPASTANLYAPGNVGIGTSNPQARLHVRGNTLFQSTSGDVQSGFVAGGTNYFSLLYAQSTSGTMYAGVNGTSAGSAIDIGGILDNVTFFGSRTTHATQLISNNTVRVTIASGGNVGIANPAPDHPLDVSYSGSGIVGRFKATGNNASIVVDTGNTSGGSAIVFKQNGAQLGVISTDGYILGTGGTDVGILADATGGKIKFYTNGSPFTKFTIGAAGQWGIGNTPSYGTAGQVLTSQGSGAAPSWENASGGGGTPGGSNRQLQFNNSGAFGGSNLYYGYYQVGSTGHYIDQLSIGTGTDTANHPAFLLYKSVDNTTKCSTSENTIGLYSGNGNVPFSIGQLNHHTSGYVTSAAGNYVTVGVAATAISSGWVPTQWPSGTPQSFPCIGVYSESNGQVGNQGGTAFYGTSRPYYSNATGYYTRIHNAATSGVGYGYRVDIGTHPFGSGAYGFVSRIISGQGGNYSNCTGWLHIDETSSGNTFAAKFARNGSDVGNIQLSTSNTTYNTSSDPRLKNITGLITADEAKNFVMALQPKKGTWKVDGSDFKGFLSTEYELIDSKAVSGIAGAIEILGKVFDADNKMLSENVPQPPANLLPPGGRWEQTQVKDIYQTLEYGSAAWCANMTAFIQSMQTTLTAQNQIVQELKAEFDAYKASHP